MYDTELAKGHEAVRLASKLCQKVQRQLTGEDEQSKTDDSPVTVADYGASLFTARNHDRTRRGVLFSRGLASGYK